MRPFAAALALGTTLVVAGCPAPAHGEGEGEGAGEGDGAAGEGESAGESEGAAGEAEGAAGEGEGEGEGVVVEPGDPGAADVLLAVRTDTNRRAISRFIYGINGDAAADGLAFPRSGGH